MLNKEKIFKKKKESNKVPLIQVSNGSEYPLNLSEKMKSNEKKLVDSLLILDPTGAGEKDSKRKFIDRSEEAFKYDDNAVVWDISDNFKEVLRKEVVEYIVKAFDSIFEIHRREDDITKEIDNVMVDIKKKDNLLDSQKTDKQKGWLHHWFGTLFKKFDENDENFEFNKRIDDVVYGHPESMKRVDLLSKDDVEEEAKNETTFQIFRNKSYINEIIGLRKQDFSQSYEVIELAPILFHNIRKMSKIRNEDIKNIFSLKNLKKLHISVSQGKGGTFFIRPVLGNGKILIKSISAQEYISIKNFLPNYYCYLLMNPSSYLLPILGVFKMKLHKNSSIAPITFIIMRDGLDISRHQLGPSDRMYTFDLKGSRNDRQVLLNPMDIFDIDASYVDYKDLIFKDIDFIKSFTKWDVTSQQGELIMSQLNTDIDLLEENKSTDYSMIMHIIIRPYSSLKVPSNYLSHCEREVDLFNQNVEPAQDKIDDKKVPKEETKEFHVDTKFRGNSEEEVLRYSSTPPQPRKTISYLNKKTGQKELLNLFKGSGDHSSIGNNENQPHIQFPLKMGLSDLSLKNEVAKGGNTLTISKIDLNWEGKEADHLSPTFDGSIMVLKEEVIGVLIIEYSLGFNIIL